MVVITKKIPLKRQETGREQQWGNPENPENAADERDSEQLKRQKKDVEQKNENLDKKPEKN